MAKKKEKEYKVFRGKAYWFNNLLNKNKYSDKYELVLGNLSEEQVKLAKDTGLYVRSNVPGKEEQGSWVKFKSGFPPRKFKDRTNRILSEYDVQELGVGNGSDVAVRVNIWHYEPNASMQGATGVAGSVEAVQLINVIEYDSDDGFENYDSEENEQEEVPDYDDTDEELNDEVPF